MRLHVGELALEPGAAQVRQEVKFAAVERLVMHPAQCDDAVGVIAAAAHGPWSQMGRIDMLSAAYSADLAGDLRALGGARGEPAARRKR